MTNESTTTAVPEQYPGVSALIHKSLPAVEFVASNTSNDVDLRVRPENFLALVEGMNARPELAFDYLRNVAGVDMEALGLEVKYHFYSFAHNNHVQITVPTPPGDPHVPTLTHLFAGADWHEREAAEMFGLVFDGHPNLKNLLLEEDLRIHPLLKAHPLQKGEIFQGIEDTTPGFKF
jgi:NADH-quinone oxidoreductase subunit C